MVYAKGNMVRKTRMMRVFWVFLMIFFQFNNKLIAQTTIRVTAVPQYFMPVLDSVFIAGTFNAWNPGDAVYQLQKDFDGSYFIVLDGTEGEGFEFKFTRGDWARGETMADGSFLPNRTGVFADGSELTFTVANWEDQTGTHTINGNVIQLDYNFEIPELNRSRRIWIYLPPDYFTSTNYYPVVYMQDGQNVFDYASSFAGEWDVDGSMQNIISNGHTAAIVVAIANGEIDRIDEYSAWNNPTYGGGDGDKYAQFIVNTLKPYIDANYRTLSDRMFTAIGGSSLGGLISYYTALEYDSVFSKALIFSPSFWFDDSVNIFTENYEKTLPLKLYFTAGATEDVDMVPDINTVTTTLFDAGFTSDEILTVIRADGAHSEWFWKREYDDGFLWLFDDVVPLAVSAESNILQYFYNAQQQIIYLQNISNVEYQITDMQGKPVLNGHATQTIDCSGLERGMYICAVHTNNIFTAFKFVVI